MADAAEALVLISGSSIDIDTDAREGSGERFSGHPNAIGKFGDLIEFDRILKTMSWPPSVLERKSVPFAGHISLWQNLARQTWVHASQLSSLPKLL